ncbi:MAG TPA: hypothetical protein VKC54_01175, partial [Patescibacteria group bacterium]|nr:hypothetical protein [Patescibacteria group bacterium]
VIPPTVPTVVPEAEPTPSPLTQPLAVTQESTPEVPPMTTGEKPKGSSMLMKVAIWILVAALLVAIGYVVYANFFSTPSTVTTKYVPPVASVVPAPVTETPLGSATPEASASPSGSPTGSPTSSPSASPGI